MIAKFYYVRGQIFENSNNRYNAKGKALRYCKENNINDNEIYELSNDSELAYLKKLLSDKNVVDIKSHIAINLVDEFTNANKDLIPCYKQTIGFSYKELVEDKTHFVSIIHSAYDITKDFILAKTTIDYYFKNVGYYLEVYYLDNGEWKEWKIGNIELFAKEKKERKQKALAQKKVIRDMEKYDRLLKAREQGKITERQSQELYRLEKVFGSKNV